MIRLIDQFTMDPVVGPLVRMEEQFGVDGLLKYNLGWSGLPEVPSTLPGPVPRNKGGLYSFGGMYTFNFGHG